MLMKIIPIFIVVLSIGSFAQTNDPEQAKFIEKLNSLRRESANSYGISNMHELTYNKDLAQIAGKQDYQNQGYLYVWFEKYENVLDNMIKYVKNFKILDSKTRDEYAKDPQYNLAWYFVNPPQTKIGCAINSDLIVCIFGDPKELSGWKKSDEMPGSRCKPDYYNSDGLCVYDMEQQKKFIAELNEERRLFAKENKISNMHKLVFSPHLADIAQSANWTGTDLVGARVTWRYTVFKSYQDAKAESRHHMRWFMSQSKEEKSNIIEDGVKLFFRAYEHLVPPQRIAGCSVRGGVLCLLGPEITFSMSDFESSNARCTNGYTLIDGLCTRGEPVAATADANSGSQVTVKPVVNVDPSTDAPEKPEEKKTAKPTSPSSSQNQVDSQNKHQPTVEQNSPTPPTDSQAPDPEQKSPKPPVSAPIPQTTTESELDRKIAAYKANEQDGDVPSEEDVTEYEFSNCGRFLDPLLISVVFVVVSVWIE